MRKLEIQDADIIKIAVQQEIERSEESRYDHRLHAILMVCSGISCNQVAELFGHSARTVQYWLHRFEEKGFAGLYDIQRPGRPLGLDKKQRHSVGVDLRQSPRDLGYSQSLWDDGFLAIIFLRNMVSTLVSVNVKGCFINLVSGVGNPALLLRRLIQFFSRNIKKLIRLAKRDNFDLWFEDECHFQQHGSRCVMWIPSDVKDPYHAACSYQKAYWDIGGGSHC